MTREQVAQSADSKMTDVVGYGRHLMLAGM